MTNDRENKAPAGGLEALGIGPLNVGNLLDTVDFVKNAWSAFGVPSSLAPTTDIDELDRRISDLKAVEQWLAMNLNLLKTSVQALEIQRGTIATLKAYGSMIGAPASLPGANALAQAMAGAASGAMAAASGASQVPGVGSMPATTAPDAAAHVVQTPAAAMASAASGEPVAEVPTSALPGFDAGAWWEMLHRQFNQIAAAALGAQGEPAETEPPKKVSGARRADREGAPVARGRKTPAGRKTKSTGGPEPGRRGRRPAR